MESVSDVKQVSTARECDEVADCLFDGADYHTEGHKEMRINALRVLQNSVVNAEVRDHLVQTIIPDLKDYVRNDIPAELTDVAGRKEVEQCINEIISKLESMVTL